MLSSATPTASGDEIATDQESIQETIAWTSQICELG
jgi:hypothetical protein